MSPLADSTLVATATAGEKLCNVTSVELARVSGPSLWVA